MKMNYKMSVLRLSKCLNARTGLANLGRVLAPLGSHNDASPAVGPSVNSTVPSLNQIPNGPFGNSQPTNNDPYFLIMVGTANRTTTTINPIQNGPLGNFTPSSTQAAPAPFQQPNSAPGSDSPLPQGTSSNNVSRDVLEELFGDSWEHGANNGS
jgi:hypothetical protein